MAYDYDEATGEWVWRGEAIEPGIGESKPEYAIRALTPVVQEVAPGGEVDISAAAAAIPAITGILATLGVSAGFLGTLGALGAAAYGIYELFDGEQPLDGYAPQIGNGGVEPMSYGTDITGRGVVTNGGPVPVNGSPFGLGVPEPPAAMVAKQWKTKAFSKRVGEYWVYFFRLIDGRVMCWNEAKRQWKIWKPRKNIVLSSDPRLSDIRRAERAVFGKLKSLAKKSDFLALQKRR